MNLERIFVQLIEDNPADARLVKEALRNEPGMVIKTADRISTAIGSLSDGQTDVILLDLGLPDSEGLDALHVLSNVASHVPIVVITGHEDEELGRRIIGMGAQDYLVKPVMPGTLLARTLYFAIERKRAEVELRGSEAKYRQLHESLMDGFVSVDLQGRIMESNSTYQQMLGYSGEELRSLTIKQLTPECWHEREDEIIAEQIMPRGYSDVYEKEYRRKSGEVFPIELRTSLLRDASGARVGMWAIVRDLTERKRAEKALRESEESIRRKLDSVLSPEGDWGALELADIIDSQGIQSLMDRFYELARIPMSIVDLKGRILVGVGWQDICSKFHRMHPDACRHCIESDLELTHGIGAGDYKIYKCKNNMWDVATPIVVGERHVGNVFVGQFFFEDELLDYKLFRSQARRYGFNEEAYISALESVPRLNRESLNTGLSFLMRLAVMISKLSYSNIKLARSLAERDCLTNSLSESEERFRQLFNAATVPLCFVDKEGVLEDINDRFTHTLGYTIEDVPTLREWWQLACPDPDYSRWAAETWNASLQRAILRNTDIDPIECRITCKNGDERTLVISGITIGENFLATFFDITDRKRAEESLRTSEAQLSDALKTALLGYWEYDVANNLFTFNNHFYAIMRTNAESEGGYTMTAAQYVDRFVHPDDRSKVRAELQINIKSADSYYGGWMEHRIVYADGESGYVSVRFFAITDEEGRLIKTSGVSQDITERRRVEEALKKSESQYRLIADNTTDVIWLYDLALDQFAYISPSVKKLWGYDVEEALRLKIQDSLTPECNRRMTESVARQIAGFKAGDDFMHTQTYEVDRLRKDGSIVTTEAVITLISDEQRNVSQIQGISRDITERKLLQRQLLQAQKMEAVGRLAGGIAHDFNNLLTIIIGYSDSLLNHLPRGAPAREELELIRRSGDRAAALTSKLLAFSRKQIIQLKVIDLKNQIQESLKLLRRLIGEDIELTTTLAPDLGCVKADVTQIEQIMMNLAVNSRDAMPQGGKLILEAANVYLDEEFVSNHVGARQGEYIMLAMTDTGLGMSAETKAHLFEPFFTTKEIGKGTGLGLAIVYGIVTQSGGFITVESELQQGTTFRIYLPRVERSELHVKPSEPVSTNGSGTILLVEDADDVRKLASRFLQEKGYAVLAADNGPSAIRMAKEHEGIIHLLLTDMVMPGGMTGLEVAKSIRNSYPDVKVIIITGYIGGVASVDSALNSDIALLQKPFTANDLIHQVHKVLQEGKV
jgi:two-component system, cell cycle sensor histidine kinase and response regulator CckA